MLWFRPQPATCCNLKVWYDSDNGALGRGHFVNEFLIGIFDSAYAKGLAQPYFYFLMAIYMGIKAITSRQNPEEAWRYEIVAIFCFGISAVLWQLSK